MIPLLYEWSSDAPVAMTNDYRITVREDLVMISAEVARFPRANVIGIYEGTRRTFNVTVKPTGDEEK